MRKKKNNRIFGILPGLMLICAVLTGFMPGQVLRVSADPGAVNKYNPAVTSVGVSGITNPQNARQRSDAWTGNYVYYGKHLFRVLDTDTTDFSADDGILPQKHTMLLDSDSVIGLVPGEHIHFDNDGNPNQGAERANEWEYSDLKAWLNDSDSGFLKQFSKAEIEGIANSTKPDPVTGDGKGFPNMRYAPLKDDHVFVLDAVEASRQDYGYYRTTGDVENSTDAYSRVKESDGSYYTYYTYEKNSGNWWLRSPFYGSKYPNHAGFVFGANSADREDGGYFTTNFVTYRDSGPSPALNVDLDSVLLSTIVKSGGQYYNNEYKLTLIYDGLETAITQRQYISINGSDVTVPFTVTDKDPYDGITADCVSVLVVRDDGTNRTITKYDKLTSSLNFGSNVTVSGEVTFHLPDGYKSSTDHIYIFAEDTQDSNYVTDYASAPLALMQPGAESGLVYDGNFHSLLNNDMRTIPSGHKAVYALSENGSYSTEIPTARDAGVHRIWYKITDNNTTVFGPLSMTVTIAKKQVRVSGITAAEKQYDGERNVTLSGGTLNPSDIIPDDDISIASLEGRFKYADAGDNKPVTITKITLDGTSKDNYAPYVDQNSLTAKVTQKPVTVTGITANDKEYDGTKTATIKTKIIDVNSQIGDAQIDGVVTNDNFSLRSLTVSSKNTVAQFENAAVGDNKTVNLEIKLGGYCSGNYTVSADSRKTATANITPRSITVKAKNQSVGVGGTIESGADNVSITNGSLAAGHSISAVTLTSSATDTITDAGTITLINIVITDADGGIVTDNYSITLEGGVLTVTSDVVAKVTAVPKASEITYGQKLANSALTGGTGNVAGTFAWADDTIMPAVSNSNKTEYDVVFTPTVTSYSPVRCTVMVTVNRKSVTITGLAVSNKEYDGTTAATVTGTADIAGKLDGGDVTVSAGTAAFADADAGENKDVSFSGWSLTGSDAGNYELSAQPTGVKATITPKSIIGATVILDQTTFEFDETEKKVSVTGVKLSDGTVLESNDYNFADDSQNSGTAEGTYTVKVNGKGNYCDSASVTWSIVHPKDYSISVEIEGKGTVEVIVRKSVPAQAGNTVKLIVKPDTGYELESLTYTADGGDPVDIKSEQSFKMPAANVAVDAIFTETEQPGPGPEPEPHHDSSITFFRLVEGIALPKTGFSTASLLPEKPMDLNYKPLRRTLEIPSVSVFSEIVSVPFAGGEYPVTWLGADAGLLEGSALPGKGQSVLTGHNHLNMTEAGPFANLNSITAGDRIFVRNERGNLQVFVVYANMKVAENDISGVNRIIASDPQSLTLITCEDERPEGGYANRRVVAAKPL